MGIVNSSARRRRPFKRLFKRGPSEDVTRASMHISILPPELISLIFCFAIPELVDRRFLVLPRQCKDFFLLPTTTQAPLNVSCVSRWWRAIAHETPQLWSRIVATQSGALMSPAWESSMKEWLSRTGSVPLDIIWTSGTEKSEVFELIMRNAGRWRGMLISGSNDLLTRVYASICATASPIECLVLISTGRGNDSELNPLVNIVGLPRLRLYSGGETVEYFDSPSLQFPLAPCPQLQRLQLSHRMPWRDILHCLDFFPSLVEIECQVLGATEHVSSDDLHLLPKLWRLSIGFYQQGEEFTGCELDHLRTPSLERLSIHRESMAEADDQLRDRIISLISRSNLNLRTLSLHGRCLRTSQAVVDVLEKTPRLYRLLVSHSESLGDALLRTLSVTMQNADGTTQPLHIARLNKLVLCGHQTMSVEVLANLISTRWSLVKDRDTENAHNFPPRWRQLQTVKVNQYRQNGIEGTADLRLHPAIAKCIEEGFRLRLSE